MSTPPLDPQLAPAPRRARAARLLLALFFCWHLLAVLGSLTSHTPPGILVRENLTRPYEKLLGVYQSWSMFVPNAPKSSEWLVATGETGDGRNLDLPVLAGDLPPDRIEWWYRRGGKLERNAMEEGSRRHLRQSYTDWACREARARGLDVREVTLMRAWRRTPPPNERAITPRAFWAVGKERLTRNTCPDATP